MTVVMLGFFYTFNLIGIPFRVWLSNQIGKHRAYAATC